MSTETNPAEPGCGCETCSNGDDRWCCESCHSLAKQMSPAEPDAGDVEALLCQCHEAICPVHKEAADGQGEYDVADLMRSIAAHDAEVRRTAAKETAERDPFLEISAALDAVRPDLVGTELQMWRRVTKVCEESGEVWRALSGYVAENPRKGQTHSLDDLLGELLDTASAALCAWAHLHGNNGDPVAALVEHATATADRLAAARIARAEADQ